MCHAFFMRIKPCSLEKIRNFPASEGLAPSDLVRGNSVVIIERIDLLL